MPKTKGTVVALPLKKEEIIRDYRRAYQSRQASLIGRREVLSGKAKFGIFGDGKELANIAIARAFQKGDWRSGYYRDQTWMFMLGVMSIQEFFAQLYAHADVESRIEYGRAVDELAFCVHASSTPMARGKIKRICITPRPMSLRPPRRCRVPLGWRMPQSCIVKSRNFRTSHNSQKMAMKSPSPALAMPPQRKACFGRLSMPSVS